MIKRSPFVALVLCFILTIYIYMSFQAPKLSIQKKEPLSLSEQVQDAFFNIKNSENPEMQMKGILELRRLADENPKNADLQWSMGMFSMQSGQYQKAINRFKNVLNIDLERQDASIQLALCYTALNDTSNALIILGDLIKNSNQEIKNKALKIYQNLK